MTHQLANQLEIIANAEAGYIQAQIDSIDQIMANLANVKKALQTILAAIKSGDVSQIPPEAPKYSLGLMSQLTGGSTPGMVPQNGLTASEPLVPRRNPEAVPQHAGELIDYAKLLNDELAREPGVQPNAVPLPDSAGQVGHAPSIMDKISGGV